MSNEAKSPIPLTKSKNSRRHNCRSRHGLEAVGRLILKVPRYFLPDLASVNAERSGTSRTGPLSAKKEAQHRHLGSSDPESSRCRCGWHLFFSYSSWWRWI